MHIRVAICAKEETYVNRLYTFWDKHYKDKVEVGVFFEREYLDKYLENHNLDFILFGDEWKRDVEARTEQYPAYAYLVDEILYNEGESRSREIKRYQRADAIYRDLIEAYAAYGQIRKESHSAPGQKGKTGLHVFCAPGNGAGASSIAEVYARRCAQSERVLKLNMQFCTGEEEATDHRMDDILFALKSRRYVLPLKLEAGIRMDEYKVSRITLCSNPMEMLDISHDEMGQLLDGIRDMGNFDKIVVDMDGVIGGKERLLLEKGDRIICVTDESDSCLKKFLRFRKAMLGLKQVSGIDVNRKLSVFCNKNQSDVHQSPYREWAVICGSAPRYQDADWENIVRRLEESAVFIE